jgi:hypothetical protein
MDAARAAQLRDAWAARHRDEEEPTPGAMAAVERLLTDRVPDAESAAALIDADGRRRIGLLAGGALYLVWAVPAGVGRLEAARCRRLPLEPAPVEVSDRLEAGGPVRHWWFELEDEPLVFRAGSAEEESFAQALAAALGWSVPVP